MTTFRRELPGDVLRVLIQENDIETVSDFDKQHQNRTSLAIDKHAKSLSEDEQDAMFEQLASNYQKWTNRFAITWQAYEENKGRPRALFLQTDLDSLVFAGWFDENSQLHERFRQAMRLQTAIYLNHLSEQELEEEFQFQSENNLKQIYDALCRSFYDGFSERSETRHLEFAATARLAQWFSRNTLDVLQNVGLLEPPDGTDWDSLFGLDETRRLPMEENPAHSDLVQALYEWGRTIVEQGLAELPLANEEQ